MRLLWKAIMCDFLLKNFTLNLSRKEESRDNCLPLKQAAVNITTIHEAGYTQ